MNRRLLLTLICCTPLGLKATPSEAEAKLRSAINEVLTLADRASTNAALTVSVRPVLLKYVSFETMTKRAIGVGWRQFSAAEQKRASELFTTLVIRTYIGKFTPGERPVIDYKVATSPATGRVDVPTTLIYKGSRYAVTYRMEQIGGWRIADVVIEGVSMIANYRSQLDATFKQGGAEAVIRSLEQSVSR